MSTSSFTFQNTAYITYKSLFESQTGIKLEKSTVPIYLEYLKVIFASQQAQLGVSIHGDLQGLLKRFPK